MPGTATLTMVYALIAATDSPITAHNSNQR